MAFQTALSGRRAGGDPSQNYCELHHLHQLSS
jgi:hypothetical protein